MATNNPFSPPWVCGSDVIPIGCINNLLGHKTLRVFWSVGKRNHHTAPSNTSRVCTLYLLSAHGGHSSPPWICISLWWELMVFLGLAIVSLNSLTGNLIILSGVLSRQMLAMNQPTSCLEKNQPSFPCIVGSLHWTPTVLLNRWLLNGRLHFTFHSETKTQKIQAQEKQISSWVKIR